MSNENIDYSFVKEVVLDLYIKQDRRPLAWQVLEQYFRKAKTLREYDIIGYIALKVENRNIYLKSAEYAYTLAQSSQEKYFARVNLFKAYNVMNMPEKALFYIEQNLEETPDDLETLCNKSFNLSLMNRKVEAEAMLSELIKKNPDMFYNKEHNYLNSAFAGKFLREGQTARGLLSFVEAFKPDNVFFEHELKMSKWKGAITPGKKLYVDMEGGYGDQIINIRFFDRIKSMGMEPILFSQSTDYYHNMNMLLKRHGYSVVTDPFLIDRTCSWAPMMSIPGYLGLKESQLWTGPYLKPLRQEKNLLTSKKFKIGIKNSGNPYFWQDEYRNVPMEQILNILPNNVEIYYIDNKKLKINDHRIIDLSERIKDWEDTLDFIDQMDCIVSTCTSIVHAAGAMNKTTFVLIPIAEYYIWTSTRTDGSSPWYDRNLYLAKQTKVRDWSEPLQKIKIYVENLFKEYNE